MIENTHSVYHLLLLSSLVDLAYLVQNQLQESTLSCCVVVCVCVCACKCFHRFTAFMR